MLVNKIEDKDEYIKTLITIHKGLSMLDPNDIHRKQVALNL